MKKFVHYNFLLPFISTDCQSYSGISGFWVYCRHYTKENEVLNTPWPTFPPKTSIFYKASLEFKNRIEENTNFHKILSFPLWNKYTINQGFQVFRFIVDSLPKRTKCWPALSQHFPQRPQRSTNPLWGSKIAPKNTIFSLNFVLSPKISTILKPIASFDGLLVKDEIEECPLGILNILIFQLELFGSTTIYYSYILLPLTSKYHHN